MDALPSPSPFDLGPYSDALARRLPELRERAGLSQRVLARVSGVAPGVIKKIEAGEGNPTLDTLLRLQQALNVSCLEEFFGKLPSQQPST